MATRQERNDQSLRQAHRQLSQAIMALDDAAHELGIAGWHVTAAEVGAMVTTAENAQSAMERYAAGAGVTL